ncbi:MAG: phage portal protein [Oscillospiraceae bacterium]
MPAPQIDGEYLGLSEEEMERLQAQIVREFSLWADTPVCDAERIDNFYQLQQLAFMGYLMNGDEIALLPMKRQVGQPYDLRVQLVEADRVCSPDGFDRLMPCTVQGYKVPALCKGSKQTQTGWWSPTGCATITRWAATAPRMRTALPGSG